MVTTHYFYFCCFGLQYGHVCENEGRQGVGTTNPAAANTLTHLGTCYKVHLSVLQEPLDLM